MTRDVTEESKALAKGYQEAMKDHGWQLDRQTAGFLVKARGE
jgi:hypothetical protein